MKLALVLLALACIQFAYAGSLVTSPYGPHGPTFSPKESGYEVDRYVRDKYWYYLDDAQLYYMAHIQYRGGFLFIHQYRNYIGTFMAISKYVIPFRKIKVVTFVRLGDGVQSSYNAFEPIEVRPFAISMDLGYGEYHVPRYDKHEKPNWSEQWAKQQFYRTRVDEEAANQRCVKLDSMVRKNYYYYLDKAMELSSSNSIFGNYCYCMITYVNRMGIWQVIGSDSWNGMEVNTFVRLGDGYDTKKIEKCIPYPSFNAWNF